MTKADTLKLTPGTPVFCTVHGGAYGWWKFTAVRPRDGYIRISGFKMWCQPSNFELNDPREKPKE